MDWSNKEVNAVDVVQEIVEITVKSVWLIRKTGGRRTTATETDRLAAGKGSLHVWKEMRDWKSLRTLRSAT